MAQKTDDEIFADIITNEGTKYTNHKNDKGGPTKFGITIPAWETFSGKKATADTIKRLTLSNAKAYYRGMHIRPFDIIADPIRLLMIDLSILRGLHTSIMMLQGAVLGVEVDGWIGPKTLGALHTFENKVATNLLVGARLQHIYQVVKADPTQKDFVNGWRRRTLKYVQS